MSERDITALNRQLWSAVSSKSRDEVEWLLDLGVDVNACDDVYARTVLIKACRNGYKSLVELLADINRTGKGIREETHNKATDAGKLMAVIEAKREQVGKVETVKESLRACHWIYTPIDREVEDELEKKGKEC
ncbi:uncharacterized protein LOC134196227 [Corticium candelabrum]|uniref:uncharacterized protein LOC134196227 n=1 Tax=Corticium candelabrum TaxID=121492 RepID=UPI002E256D44|nr:uncharacterized protein LOC134196227 [Corticium candelabrum]